MKDYDVFFSLTIQADSKEEAKRKATQALSDHRVTSRLSPDSIKEIKE